MQLPAGEVEKIRLAAFFHDIGKIGIPESILNKPGPLTLAEQEVMRQHPVIGARQILQPVSALRDIVPLVEYHHERWDGTGHPVGLKGENIPVGARIVSIVDAFHALTSNRPYRSAMALEDAIIILEEGAGRLWDPALIDCFVTMVRRAQATSFVTQTTV
jgi:HD-GYP domain-containing protein (c-di-GMP phosphodiesterase class II)